MDDLTKFVIRASRANTVTIMDVACWEGEIDHFRAIYALYPVPDYLERFERCARAHAHHAMADEIARMK